MPPDEQPSSAFIESESLGVVESDAGGKILRANRAFLDLVGYGERELPSLVDLTPAEYQHQDAAGLKQLNEGQPLAPYAKELIHRNGKRVSVLVVTAVAEESRFVTYLLDRTERRNVEIALIESREVLEKTLDSALDAVITINQDDIITEWRGHSEQIFGWNKEEVVGKELVNLIIPPDYRDKHLAGLRKYLETGVGPVLNKRIELEALNRNGDVFPVELTISPITVQGRTHFCAFVRDLTERKAYEARIMAMNEELEVRVEERTAELKSAYNELESFSYSVSHDLRAPIRAMNAFSNMLLEDYADQLDQEGKDHLLRIRAASINMSRMIQDLLNLARVSRLEVEFSRVDLTAIVKGVIQDLEEREPDRKVEMVIAPRLSGFGDPGLLRLLFENLLDNAWKFTSRQATARIEVGVIPGKRKTYFVKDNGVGFDQTYEHKLFGVFERLHSAEHFAGTGIGLATVHRIVKRHSGEIFAQGRPGEGATFYFTLGK